MGKISVFFFMVVCCLFGCIGKRSPANTPGPTDFSNANWELISDYDGIKVFKWKVPGSESPAFQAEGMIHVPISKVVAAIKETNRRTEWSPRVKQATLLKKISKTQWIEYWHLGTPLVVRDRELVITIDVQFDQVARRLVVPFYSVESESAPTGKYVRATVLGGAYILSPTQDGQSTNFIFLAHIDLGGTVPKWMTRSIQEEYPRNTIEGLRKQVLKPSVSDFTPINLLFEGKAKSTAELPAE